MSQVSSSVLCGAFQTPSVSQVSPVQYFKLPVYLQVGLPSQVILSVLELPSPVNYSKLPVYEQLALSMAEAVMVHSLDLIDSYYTLSVSSLY